MRRRPPPKRDLLEALTDAEAACVLRQHLARHPELREEVVGFVRSKFATVDRDGVAAAVRAAILAISVDDIWDRSGERVDGYVEEVDAAWEVFTEALDPFSDQVVRLFAGGEPAAALATLEGALVALHDLPQDSGDDDALSRAQDFPAEAAATLVDRWVAAGGGASDPAFLRQAVPRWPNVLAHRR